MNTTIIVMLLWLGDAHGGPTIIQGFETVAACDKSKPIVLETYRKVRAGLGWLAQDKAECIELPKR